MNKYLPNYDSLFYLNPNPCLRYEVDTFRILDVNKATIERYGYTEKELLSLTLKDINFKELSSHFVTKNKTIQYQDGNVNFGISTHQKKSGDLMRVEINGHRADFADSECIIATCQAISSVKEKKRDVNFLMDASLDVFCSIDQEGKFEYVSAAAETHWGYTPEELVGTPYLDLIIEADISKTNDIAEAIFSGRKVKSFDNRYKKKNGGIAYNLWSASWDATDRLMYCVARDNKEIIEEEERIHQSELRFKALVQEGSDLIAILDQEGNYVYISPTSITVLGIPPETFIGKSAFEFIHPDDIENTLASLQRITTEARVQVAPFRFRNNEEEWRWIETVLTNMMDNPAVNGIVANSRDITEKIEENRKIKLFEKLIDSITDAIIVTEAEPSEPPGPVITYVNEAFASMTGYTKEEVLGKNPRFLQGPDTNREVLKVLGKKIKKWEPSEVTLLNYTKAGEEYWANFILSPVADHNGWFTHWISIQRNVTNRINKGKARALMAQISLIFGRENDYSGALHDLCKALCDFGKFDWVEVWTVSVGDRSIQRIDHFLSDPADELLYASDPINSFKPGEGLPGLVWSKKEQLVWSDIDLHTDFVRRKLADSIGLKSTAGIPLIFHDKVIGVLLVGTKKDESHLKKHTWVFEQLERHIGSEVNRKKLENDLNQLYNTIPDIVCLADFEGRFLKINQSGCKLLGYQEDEILQCTLSEFIHKEDRVFSANEIDKLSNRETSSNFENRYIAKNGSILWLSWSCIASREEGVIYATARNITAEKKLRELTSQTGKLARVGSWEIDLLDDTLYWSDMVHLIHETNPDEYTPTLSSAIHFYREDFQKLVHDVVQDCISTGKESDFEAVIITSTKKERWIRSLGRAEFNEGKCIKVYGSIQDINEQKEAELRLQSLADNLPGVVFQFLMYPDGKKELRFVSKGATKIWGFSAEDAMKDIRLIEDRVLFGGQFEEVRKSIAHSIESRTNWTSRWKYVMPDGDTRTHLGYGSPIFFTDGTIQFNSVVMDVTQEEANKELLEQVTKLAKIGSWEIDVKNNKLLLSTMVRSILEVSSEPSELDIQSLVPLFRNDFQAMVHSKLTACLEKGIPFDFEAVAVTSTKNEVWVRVIGEVEMVEGMYHKIYGSLQDINSFKEVENRLYSLSENLPGVMYQYLIHPDGTDTLKFVSGEVEQIWGYTAQEVMDDVNLIWNQIRASGCFDEVVASIQKSIQTRSKWTSRIKYILPSGEHRNQLSFGTPSFWADGTILYSSIVLDITQEVKNEELLNQASEMARIGSWEFDLIHQSQDALYWSPMVKKILEVDEAYDPNPTVGAEFYNKASQEKIQNAVTRLIKEGTDFDEELLMVTGKGNDRWVRCIGKSETGNNKRTKVYGSFQDIHIQKSLELRVSQILGSISDAFYAVDNEMRFTYLNKEAEKLLQLNEQEVIGKVMWEILPAPVKTKLYKTFENIIHSGIHETVEFFYPVDSRWYEIIAYPSVEGVSIYFKNINDRKVAAEMLQKAFEEKNNILESIGDAFYAVTNTWIVTYWNKEAEIILGRKKEQIVGKPLWEEYPDIRDSDFYHQYNKALKTNEAVYFETYYSTLEKWFEVSAYPTDEGLSVYFKDVTLRKEADIRLQIANERFEKVTEATNDVIWDWDLVNQTFYRSKAVERLFGKKASKALGNSDFWKDRCHPNDLNNIQTSISKSIADPSCYRWELEYRIFNEEGKTLFVIDRGVIIRNNDGTAIRMVGAMTDITEQKHMILEVNKLNKALQQHTMELERSNEDLEQFALVASHDLQEPLRMITGFMSLLEEKYKDKLDEKAHQYIHFATDGAKRMKQIILDLLDYSRARRPTEGQEEVDMNELLSDFKRLRRNHITEKKATITSDQLPVLTTYKPAITQIIHCLLDNALKYAQENKPPIIEIKVAKHDKEWEFSIRDNGIGIDPQFFGKIFIVFQRLHNRDQYSGTGIGLSIAKRHVEFLGGKIWLDSVVGESTVFYFTIPIT